MKSMTARLRCHTPFYYPDPEKSIETGILVTSQSLLDLFTGK